MPRSVLRAQLRDVALALLAAGERVNVQHLRAHGVRGDTSTLIAIRDELVAAGELPPEVAARNYSPPKHPPGKAISRQPQSSQPSAVSHQELLGPRNGHADNSRRLVQEYNSAVRHIFGRARARQIGAC